MLSSSNRASAVTARVAPSAIVLATLLASSGCGEPREAEPQYVSSAQVLKLDRKFRDQIPRILMQECGTPWEPRLLGGPDTPPAQLKRGAAVYTKYCRQCHGVSGDGFGPAAAGMLPRPRDYRAGVFKFTSTTYGSKPLRDDLVRTVRRGIRGTSMPSFNLLPAKDLEAVVDYVIVLTHRGELESQLADAAELDGVLDRQQVPGMIEIIMGKWKSARTQVVYPSTPMPDFTVAHIETGRSAFLTKGCSQCHGPDGRGQTKENIGVDVWGHPTKAADLTSGMLRGGTEAVDIYRHIDAGINGTPMPSFRNALKEEPATIWSLVAYVLHLSDERRDGRIPDAGILKPLPGVEAPSGAAAVNSLARAAQ